MRRPAWSCMHDQGPRRMRRGLPRSSSDFQVGAPASHGEIPRRAARRSSSSTSWARSAESSSSVSSASRALATACALASSCLPAGVRYRAWARRSLGLGRRSSKTRPSSPSTNATMRLGGMPKRSPIACCEAPSLRLTRRNSANSRGSRPTGASLAESVVATARPTDGSAKPSALNESGVGVSSFFAESSIREQYLTGHFCHVTIPSVTISKKSSNISPPQTSSPRQ